jgi:hypothetical protein
MPAPDPSKSTLESFDIKGDGVSEQLVDAIEMIGEETAAGMPHSRSEVTAGMRYLHTSRTIHQLVTDRNRAVGIYLTAASLLMTACGIMLNANVPNEVMIIPMDTIKRWCLPITFAVLTVLALLMAMLMIRTRVGMIYEVAKMNALLKLPLGRVSHLNPLSVFFILQFIISLAGGFTSAMFTIFMVRLAEPAWALGGVVLGAVVGVLVTILLVAFYAITVTMTTSDEKLKKLS